MKGMRFLPFLLLLAAALPARAQEVDDPMIRWDCDPAGQALRLEMVVPPLGQVTERELVLFNRSAAFEQCRLGGASWTLLVDVIEYESGRCAQFPDTTVSLLRNGQLVLSSVVIGYNCGERPVLSAARISDPGDGEARLELCTAWKYGEANHCSPFFPRHMATALDNEALAAHARGP
jgi:hypothetical protein